MGKKKIVHKPKVLGARILDPKTSLAAAKEYTRQRVEEGVHCPCCEQYAKVYLRAIHSTMARSLVAAYREHRRAWFHLPTLTRTSGRGGEESKLRYWGLLEPRPILREDGGHAGWWRVTRTGAEFVEGKTEVRKYAQIFDSKCLGHTGEWLDIHQALGKKFDLQELLRGA